MKPKPVNNVKLGLFVIGGLGFLVLLLYMLGKNSNLFGRTYELRARFQNVQGLVPGNNVRFAGIDVGSIKRLSILNDTLIEVTMIIEQHMKDFIRLNAEVSIGTEGLVGNKVVNIISSGLRGELAREHDLLISHSATSVVN